MTSSIIEANHRTSSIIEANHRTSSIIEFMRKYEKEQYDIYCESKKVFKDNLKVIKKEFKSRRPGVKNTYIFKTKGNSNLKSKTTLGSQALPNDVDRLSSLLSNCKVDDQQGNDLEMSTRKLDGFAFDVKASYSKA
ncbi:hypothetical protein M758_10G032700 [Ceratodon purpureus]|nr:hypothetical protein M758_10G032700 [Ceratodon purpureus]